MKGEIRLVRQLAVAVVLVAGATACGNKHYLNQYTFAVRTLLRASRYLGTHPAQSLESADFVLEVTMKGFGLDARRSTATYLYTSAEAVLIDRRTGREIWSTSVSGRERMTPWVRGTGT